MTRSEFNEMPVCFDTVYNISCERGDDYFECWMSADEYIKYVREELDREYDYRFLDRCKDFAPGGYDWYNSYDDDYMDDYDAQACGYYNSYVEYLEEEGFFEPEDEEEPELEDNEPEPVGDAFDAYMARLHNIQKEVEATRNMFQMQELFSA